MSRITLILFAAILCYSCSSLKKSGRSSDSEIVKKGFNESEIIELNITNNDFSIEKAEIEIIQNDEKRKLLASLKYKYEGKYLLSIRSKTGIEIGRLFLTKDSIIINERMNKKLYFISSAYIMNKYGISISGLPLIFGDFIHKEETDNLYIDCKKGSGMVQGNILNQEINYLIDCSYKKIVNARINKESGDESIKIFFNKFKRQGNSIFPQNIEIQDSLRSFKVKIIIKRIEFKEIKKIDFIPGSNYEKVRLK